MSLHRILFLIAMTVASFAHGQSVSTDTPTRDPLLATASFSTTVGEIEAPAHEGDNWYGVMTPAMGGFGVVYERSLTANRWMWIDLAYFQKERIGATYEEHPFAKIDHATGTMNYRARISFGIDEFFRPRKDQRWGFVLGLGIGLSQAEYETKFYPRVCGMWCGFDPDSSTSSTDLDRYLFADARFGMRWRDIPLAGHKFDLAVLIVPELSRWPKTFDVAIPDGATQTPYGKYNGGTVFAQYSMIL